MLPPILTPTLRPAIGTRDGALRASATTVTAFLIAAGGNPAYDAAILRVAAVLAADTHSILWDQMELAAAESDDRFESDDWAGDPLLLTARMIEGIFYYLRCGEYYDSIRLSQKVVTLIPRPEKGTEE